MSKKYFKICGGYPSGADVFYECEICGASVPSLPAHSTECRCGNILLDVDAGRLAVREKDKIKAYRQA
jgi:hypothetical protein